MREGRIRTQALALAVCDALMVLLAMQAAWWLRFDLNAWLEAHGYWHPFKVGWTPVYPYLLAVFVTLPLFWLILRELDLYSQPESGTSEFFRIVTAALVACVLLAAISTYVRIEQGPNQQFLYSRAYAGLFLPLSVFCLFTGRFIFRGGLRLLSRKGIGQNRILFVGEGMLAQDLARAFDQMGANRVIGTLRSTADHSADALKADAQNSPGYHFKILGDAGELTRVAEDQHVDEVVIALPDAPKDVLRTLAEDCYRAHVRFRMIPDVYDMLLDHMNLALVADIPLLGMRGSRIEGINFLIKRIFDVVVASVLLIVLVPLVFIPVAIALKLSDPGPIFYFQERIGYRRRRFKFWKFRSMRVGSDKSGDVQAHKDYLKKYISGSADGAADTKGKIVYKITHDPRVTPIGRFIRRFSIDELPQFWNVLKGDMSLIGPRPPVAYEVENYRPIHLRRFEVLPGISGLWQVSGRNRLTFEEMVKLDLYYIENWSMELDVRILFKTLHVVLFHRAY